MSKTSLKETVLDFLKQAMEQLSPEQKEFFDSEKEYELYARFSLVPEQELETEEAKKALLFELIEVVAEWLDKNNY